MQNTMQTYYPVLQACPLFSGIAKDDLLRMLACLGARLVCFDKRYEVFSEGAPAKHIGILLSGAAQMSRVDYYGNRSLLGNVRAGEVFAEAFACADVSSMPITVTASEPCEVLLIDSRHILHTCENACAFHQQLIFNLMKELATKTISLHKRAEITSKRTTREKLLAYLMLCAQEAGSDSFDIPYDRQELADYLEVDRSGLSAEIGKLRDEGVLESRKKHFHLL